MKNLIKSYRNLPTPGYRLRLQKHIDRYPEKLATASAEDLAFLDAHGFRTAPAVEPARQLTTAELARVFHAFVSRMSDAQLQRVIDIQKEVTFSAMHHGINGQLDTQRIAEQVSESAVYRILQSDRDLIAKVINAVATGVGAARARLED